MKQEDYARAEKLKSVRVFSKSGNTCTIKYKGLKVVFKTEKENSYTLNAQLELK